MESKWQENKYVKVCATSVYASIYKKETPDKNYDDDDDDDDDDDVFRHPLHT
jgi:hypothetical protein